MLNKVINLKPHITEKSFALAGIGKYTFLVNAEANKKTVALNVERFFKVKVVDVNIVNLKGKVKKNRTGSGRRKDIGKAIVTLKKGDKINIFEAEEKAQEAEIKNQKGNK